MKKTIKSVTPKPKESFSKSDIEDVLSLLSIEEQCQLGQKGYPDVETWCQLRKFLLDRSMVSNSLLKAEMTGYTPSETLKLMEQPEIKDWLDNVENLKIPESAQTVIFVPCAKTKPWKNATRGIYKSYNKIIEENDDSIFFVTISEPLGVVPQSHWENFPQYDNSGLFKDVVQRSGGLFTRDWNEHFGKRYKMPWSQKDYDKSIDILAEKIKLFINQNQKEGRQFISFVGDEKTLGTHQDMINRAGNIPKENQFLKRAAARQEPYEYIKQTLENIRSKDITNFLKSKQEEKVVKKIKNR